MKLDCLICLGNIASGNSFICENLAQKGGLDIFLTYYQ